MREHVAATPPMGWSSWNRFHVDVSECLVKDVAEALIDSGMREAGYRYINLDDGWMAKERDRDGNLVADPGKFPGGMKALADYLHARGLKIGLYGDGGTMTCQRYPGNLHHEQQDAELYASWGVDYFKEDWCYSEGLDKRERYTLMRRCLEKAGRPMVFSICTASFPGAWVTEVGHLWRTTRDITNDWAAVLELIDTNSRYAEYHGPGHWNDPDMLQIGNGGLTAAESRSHFAMWTVMAAPLIAGNDLRRMDEETRTILTAPEAIAVDQDPLGIQGTCVQHRGEAEIWAKPLAGGHTAVALFNRGDTEAEISFRWEDVGLEIRTAGVRDLWNRRDLGHLDHGFQTAVAPHDTLLLCVFEKQPPARQAGPASPHGLLSENMPAPAVVCTVNPRLKWRCPSFDIARPQAAYQVVLREEETRAVWDSGRRESPDPWVRYGGSEAQGAGSAQGPALHQDAAYRWQVRVWGAVGRASGFSEEAAFTVKPEHRVRPGAPAHLICRAADGSDGSPAYPPALSWRFESADPTDFQTGFRLLVAGSAEELRGGRGDLWDTGLRYSGQSEIPYGGRGLEAGTTYWWKVHTWGAGRLASPWSEPAALELEEAPGSNLLLDGGYDGGGWGWYGIAVTDRRLVSSESRGGGMCLEMRASPRYGRRTFQDVDIRGGRAYRAETRLKLEDVADGGVRLTLTWLTGRPPRGAPLDRYQIREDVIPVPSGSSDWVSCSGRFTAPQKASAVRLRIVLDPQESPGGVWIDDNRLTEAPRAAD